MIKERPCYLYINTAHYKGNIILKIGITYNIKRRLNEFNNGVKYRFRLFKNIPQFIEYFNVRLNSREDAKCIEKLFYQKIKKNEICFLGMKFTISTLHLL